MSTYKQRLERTQQQKDAASLDHSVSMAKLQAQADLLETQRALAKLKQDLDEALSSPKFSLSKVTEMTQEITALEETIGVAQAIFDENFPAEAVAPAG